MLIIRNLNSGCPFSGFNCIDISRIVNIQIMYNKEKIMKGQDKEFFAKIKLAIFANPFSDKRAEVDRELTGMTSRDPNSEVINRLTKKVAKTLQGVFLGVKGGIKGLSREDMSLVRYAMLFHVFHQCCESFDKLIEKQIKSGESSCKASFSKDVLEMLFSYGFSEEEALRFFALFFQMRRAFYFINRIVGKSQCMKNLRKDLWNNIFTYDIGLYDQYLWNRMEDFSTMLLGETGTGKGLAAMAIGRSGFIPFDDKKQCFSESFAQAFVSINLSQYPEQLLESELFGHKKGAFTGAIEAHAGIFSRCSPCGAIFLDEIGEISIPAQIKLLQVLQDRVFYPVGSHKNERFQGRVIAATNKSVNDLRQKGLFRDDFYYRLCSDIIEIPPLRKRLSESTGELEEILSFTIQRILGKPSNEILLEVKSVILKQIPSDYSWPGNVRELEQCVRRVLLKKNYEGDLQPTSDKPASKITMGIEAGTITAQELISSYCKFLHDKLGTYEAVSQKTELDRRTVKKYIDKFR